MTVRSISRSPSIGRPVLRLRRWLAADRGSVLPMVLGALVLALALVTVVTAATSAYLLRKQLFTIADGAALAGAEAFALGDVTVRGGRVRVELDPAAVQREVRRHLDGTDAGRLEGFALVEAGSPDRRSARVVLRAQWRPPIIGLLLPEGLPIEVTATARTVFG